MNVSPNQIRIAKIVDMYIMGPDSKYRDLVKVYFKLKFPKNEKGINMIVEIFLLVPKLDIASRKFGIGSNIILSDEGRDKYRYLGSDDDWEVLFSIYKIDPRVHAKLVDTNDFSENQNDNYKILEFPNKVSIYRGKTNIASANIDGSRFSCCRVRGDEGIKALKSYGYPRGISYPKDYYISG